MLWRRHRLQSSSFSGELVVAFVRHDNPSLLSQIREIKNKAGESETMVNITLFIFGQDVFLRFNL